MKRSLASWYLFEKYINYSCNNVVYNNPKSSDYQANRTVNKRTLLYLKHRYIYRSQFIDKQKALTKHIKS